MRYAVRRLTFAALAPLLLLVAPGALGADPGSLPDIGNSAGTIISASEEQKIGRMIVRQMREAGRLVDDPIVDEYMKSVGHRLSQYAHDGNLKFTFFVVDDPSLNAFALPGGFIGVHSGLLLATADESELAGVLAHEIAHVSQKHIVRRAEASGEAGLAATAAMVAAILVGAAAGADGDAIGAAVAVAQGSAAQANINFTRAHEYEADRVGIGLLADAGFDPMGMARFFQTMSRRTGAAGSMVPEYFRTHPVTSNRIAETRDRALRLPARRVPSSRNYELAKARLKVLSYDSIATAVQSTEARIAGHPSEASESERYAYALALVAGGEADLALPVIETLRAEDEDVIAYHMLEAEAQIASGDVEGGLTTFAEGHRLFPRNVPLTMAYTAALTAAGQPARAHEIILDLVNNVRYTEEQIRLLALAAQAEGDAANAHYYMSEFHVLRGELQMAIDQLNLALASPDIHDYQIARAAARKEEIRKYLPKKRRRDPPPEERRQPGRR